ncbi:MAG: biosynthetic arginine decarboxylase [Planctomycetota bacterium]|nr:biosynthetic arginine decarboxylase [Planctomycetota bacterium]
MTYTSRDASRYYGIDAWGQGYFGVNGRGNLTVHPQRDERRIDIFGLLGRLKRHKVRFPLLLRFPQILASRVHELFDAFDSAVREFHYDGTYRGVFPIKVNQNADVVSAIVHAGRGRNLGLEAGSKAELAIALTHDLDEGAIVVCNGYKDEEYVRLALRGCQLGYKVFLIIEKPPEAELIAKVSKQMGVEPYIGIRTRLQSRGSGMWEKSTGSAAKFGLTTQELLDALETLTRHGLESRFQLLHFHAGSQITEIRRIKSAVREGARIYAKLRSEGYPLEYLDVGGGLGVDYDGSNTSYEASMNYTVREYANDVVYIVDEICGAENVPVPTLVSESGRALTAYHAVLISEVGGRNAEEPSGEDIMVPADAHDTVKELHEIWLGMHQKNHREFFHDAEAKREELLKNFDLGFLSLRDRALGERLIGHVRRRTVAFAKEQRFVPDEFIELEKNLVTKYIANFSVFQSIPDHWALDQLFPVVPIHRLGEKPTVAATLCDVTCDSYGEIDEFVDPLEKRTSLNMHELQKGKPYYIAVALIGAYQDVLGDYHNLFGRVDEAHVVVGKNGAARIVKAVPGDEAHEVLELFGHKQDEMVAAVRARADALVAARKLTRAKAKQAVAYFAESLDGYTYLNFR